MQKDKDSLFDALDILVKRENDLINSGLDSIIFRYTPKNDYEIEISNKFDAHLQNTYKFLSELTCRFEYVYWDKNVVPVEDSGVYPQEHHEIDNEKAKGELPRLTIWLNDSEAWQRVFTWIIDGYWPLRKEAPEDLLDQSCILLSFYAKALHTRNITLDDLLPIIFKVNEKVHELSILMGIWIGDNGRSTKEQITRLKKDRSRKKTKHERDWSELISLIVELDHQKAFMDATALEHVATTILGEVLNRKRNKKISHQHSLNTIRRCLSDIFDLTADNFSQPLKLVINIKI